MNIGLVAHDEKKGLLCEWAQKHVEALSGCQIYATGTTGGRLQEACPTLSITPLKSGPWGGDQQLGAMICEDQLSALIFFIDPMSPHPHDVDIKALIRLATLYDIPHACNVSTADLIAKALPSL